MVSTQLYIVDEIVFVLTVPRVQVYVTYLSTLSKGTVPMEKSETRNAAAAAA